MSHLLRLWTNILTLMGRWVLLCALETAVWAAWHCLSPSPWAHLDNLRFSPQIIGLFFKNPIFSTHWWPSYFKSKSKKLFLLESEKLQVKFGPYISLSLKQFYFVGEYSWFSRSGCCLNAYNLFTASSEKETQTAVIRPSLGAHKMAGSSTPSGFIDAQVSSMSNIEVCSPRESCPSAYKHGWFFFL